jgi:hypothetical protein
MEDSTRRATANKRLHVNQRVSGAIRDYIPGPTKHQHCHRLYGHIISAIGEWKYLVRFDNVNEKECSSALLRVEKMHMNVPPDIQLPVDSNLEHRFVLEELEIEVIDQEEEDPLGASPVRMKLKKNWVMLHRRMVTHQMECQGNCQLKRSSLWQIITWQLKSRHWKNSRGR